MIKGCDIEKLKLATVYMHRTCRMYLHFKFLPAITFSSSCKIIGFCSCCMPDFFVWSLTGACADLLFLGNNVLWINA